MHMAFWSDPCVIVLCKLPSNKQGSLHAENSYKFETISIIPSNWKKKKITALKAKQLSLLNTILLPANYTD
jgi:hypothetical protein